jgi:hypothetical protein
MNRSQQLRVLIANQSQYLRKRRWILLHQLLQSVELRVESK